MNECKATHRAPIKLGHTGENEAVRVAFSLLPFKETFPDGVPALLARRKGDAAAYPVPLTIEADTAYWAVTRADTEKAGFGQCELQWIVGNTLAKSDKFDFFVVKALEAGAEAPDAPSKAWFEAIQAQIGDLSKLTTKAKENLVAAINEAARTGGGSGGGTIDMRVSGGYIQYSNDGVTWENLIAVSELKGEAGPQGIPGEKGEAGPQGPRGETGPQGEKGADGASGKDGITPTIGANGNWYLGDTDTQKPSRGETGPQGERGLKGDAGPQGDVGPKGDSYTLTPADKSEIAGEVVAGGVQAELGDEPVSLGITGATPGQIAKITAVDTDGKPTKWEPVSEQYELLKTINIAEEINALTVTQDDNGNLFSLDSVLVYCDSGIGAGHDYKTITYRDNNNLNLTVDNALNSNRVTQFTAKNNGGFYWDEGFWASSEGAGYSQFYRNATSKAFGPINTIKLTFGEAVSQGRIRVWGIKA